MAAEVAEPDKQGNPAKPAKHHLYILETLEKMLKGAIKKRKLMVFLPPGSGKSTYLSKLFPVWFLAQRDGLCILTCAHKDELVEEFGRCCRNLVEEKSTILGYELAKDSQAAGKWSTTRRGSYLSAGVGAGIAGRRADLGLIEDPIGKKEDADSQTLKEKQWSWYQWDFMKRLKPGAFQVLITTRWCEDDLAGKLLEKEANEWVVINIPLIARDDDPIGRQPGETLWPEYFDEALVADRRASIGFMTQEQNDPTPAEGNFFKVDMLHTYKLSDLPQLSNLRIYMASDHATGVKKANAACDTCILVGGLDHNDVLWILPQLYWDRGDALIQVERGLDMAEQFKPFWWFIEEENIAKTFGPFMRKRMRERNVFVSTTGLKPSNDVLKRAQAIHARCSQGMVLFPQCDWWDKAKHQLLSFPNGKLWDFVSALGLFGLGIDRIVGGDAPKEKQEELLNVPWKPTGKWLRDLRNKQARETAYALRDR